VPGPADGGIAEPLGLGLGGQRGDLAAEGVAVRVRITDRHPDGVHLVHRVVDSVHGHVQPGREQVLVEGGAQLRRDRARVVRGLRAGGHGEDDPGGLGLQLDGAVEVEVPVEAVVVVADGEEEADHQPAATAGLRRSGEDVAVLPAHPVVLLVEAEGVANDPRVAVLIGERGVEVVDLAEAVAAQLQRVGVATVDVLAGVEVVLPEPHG
jgi:hypothetical protein